MCTQASEGIYHTIIKEWVYFRVFILEWNWFSEHVKVNRLHVSINVIKPLGILRSRISQKCINPNNRLQYDEYQDWKTMLSSTTYERWSFHRNNNTLETDKINDTSNQYVKCWNKSIIFPRWIQKFYYLGTILLKLCSNTDPCYAI